MKKYKNTIIVIIALIISALAMTLFLAPEVFTKNKESLDHPIRYKKTNCDLSKIKTTPYIKNKIVQIHSFLDSTLTDKEEVIIEEILTNSMKDSTINNLIINMHSVGLLQNLLARYDEEAHYIMNNRPSHITLSGSIMNMLFDYPEVKSNSIRYHLFKKIFSNQNLSYNAAKLYYNSYVLNDSVNIIENRHQLYFLLIEKESSLNNYSIGVLELAQEEVTKMERFTGRNYVHKNDRNYSGSF